jgi:hypothetical protein
MGCCSLWDSYRLYDFVVCQSSDRHLWESAARRILRQVR